VFTGLIQDIGTLARRNRRGDDVELVIRTGLDLGDVVLGESIAVNGACLTLTAKTDTTFSADASVETLARTSLGQVGVGDEVHLERALSLGDRLGGHIVQGHVDGTGTISRRTRSGRAWNITLTMEPALAEELVPKGSIAVDGVSLTVNEVYDDACGLTIIPHTEERTLIAGYPVGRIVNVETDVLGKYVRRYVAGATRGEAPPNLATLLDRFGYT